VTIAWRDDDRALLDKLNAASWTRTFSPERDVEWSASTTPEDFLALYGAWSLLLGSRHDAALSEVQRIRFAKYQQMNLMLFTALFERYALITFESLYRDDDDPRYEEYVTHLIKEETYHYLLFRRAIAKIRATDHALRDLPQRHIEWFLRIVMVGLRSLPSRRLRHGMVFFLLRFAEEITLQAHAVAKRTLPRGDSLVARVWALHALDEARHVVFDDMMMDRARLPGPLRRVPAWLTVPLCVMASLLLNVNEVWAARQVGVRVGYGELPSLMKRTTAPFKRKVFTILSTRLARGGVSS
jgi:hypothetical protein